MDEIEQYAASDSLNTLCEPVGDVFPTNRAGTPAQGISPTESTMHPQPTPPDQPERAPTISVVMPVFNAEPFLAETMQSIIDQTFTDFEFLVLDDGSTDRSLEIANGFASQDKRVRVIELPHAGIVPALNEGLRRARGPWIARIDSDDLAGPERFEKQLQVLRDQPELAAVGSHTYIIGETGKLVGRHSFGPTTIAEFEAQREQDAMYLMSSSVLFSRDLAVRLGGFRQDYSPTEDIDLWTRIADEHPIIVIPEPLASYRIHARSASTTKFLKQMKEARRVRENMTRRRSGIAELSVREFEVLEHGYPLRTRLRSNLAIRSQHAYRKGAGALAADDPRGVVHLVVSFLTYPPLPIGRALRQDVIRQVLNANR